MLLTMLVVKCKGKERVVGVVVPETKKDVLDMLEINEKVVISGLKRGILIDTSNRVRHDMCFSSK